MKKNVMQKLFEKVKMYKPIPEDIQDLLVAYRNKTLKFILKQQNCYSWTRMNSVKLYYFFRDKGIKLSMGSSWFVVHFVRSSVLSACIIGFMYIGSLYFPFSMKQHYKQSGIVSMVFGDAAIIRSGGKAAKLQYKTLVNPSDTIRTGKFSFVSIQVKDIGIIALLPNTTISFKSLLQKKQTSISLLKGKVLSKIAKLKNKKYNVRTKTCVVAVRGTKFSVGISKDITIVALGTGKLDITRLNDKKLLKLKKEKSIDMFYPNEHYRNISNIEAKELEVFKIISIVKDLQTMKKKDLKHNMKPKEKKVKELLNILASMLKNKMLTWPEIKKQCGGKLHYLNMFAGHTVKGCLIPSGKRMYKLKTPYGIQTIEKEKVENVQLR